MPPNQRGRNYETHHAPWGRTATTSSSNGGALGNLGQLTDLANRKVFIVTDTGVPIQYAETVKAQCADGSIFVVPQGEASKSIKVYTTVLQAMLEFGMTRADLVVAVGGGVVGDMAGFAAATYMRGHPVHQLPHHHPQPV